MGDDVGAGGAVGLRAGDEFEASRGGGGGAGLMVDEVEASSGGGGGAGGLL